MSEQDKQDKVYEMLWDCPYCDTKKLLGVTHRFCPNCGAAQDDDVRYFPSEEEKVAVEDHVYVGADKICPACDNPNAGNAEFCTQCGSPLTEAARAKRRDEELRRDGEAGFQTAKAVAKQHAEAAAAGAAKRKKIVFILLGLLAAIAVLGAVFLFWTKEVSVTLSGHSWERTIQIEEYQARQQSAWCDAMPRDAYDISRKREVRDHKKIPDGEECHTRRIDQGDGTYREQRECQTQYRNEPIYADKCYFKRNQWHYARKASANGDNLNPRWPAVRLSCSGERLGCERESARSSIYRLHFQDSANKKQHICDVSETEWRKAQVNSRWQLKVSQMTGGARCGSLRLLP